MEKGRSAFNILKGKPTERKAIGVDGRAISERIFKNRRHYKEFD